MFSWMWYLYWSTSAQSRTLVCGYWFSKCFLFNTREKRWSKAVSLPLRHNRTVRAPSLSPLRALLTFLLSVIYSLQGTWSPWHPTEHHIGPLYWWHHAHWTWKGNGKHHICQGVEDKLREDSWSCHTGNIFRGSVVWGMPGQVISPHISLRKMHSFWGGLFRFWRQNRHA